METKLLSIYTARISKSGKYLNLTLVEGEGDTRQFYTACVKLATPSKRNKIYAITSNINGIEEAQIVIPIAKYDEYKSVDEEVQVAEAVKDSDLPF